jgi:hypothetical protein
LTNLVHSNAAALVAARGRRTAALVAALRCLSRHAENDDHTEAADFPARKVIKPRRLPRHARAVPDTRLAKISLASVDAPDGRRVEVW